MCFFCRMSSHLSVRCEQKARVLYALQTALVLLEVERHAQFSKQRDSIGVYCFGLQQVLEAEGAPALQPGARRVRHDWLVEEEVVDTHDAVSGGDRIPSQLAWRRVASCAARPYGVADIAMQLSGDSEPSVSVSLTKVRDRPSDQPHVTVELHPVVSLVARAQDAARPAPQM